MRRDGKTTAFGIVSILTALGALVLQPWLDADPNTVPNWAGFAAAAGPALGLLFAADSKPPPQA